MHVGKTRCLGKSPAEREGDPGEADVRFEKVGSPRSPGDSRPTTSDLWAELKDQSWPRPQAQRGSCRGRGASAAASASFAPRELGMWEPWVFSQCLISNRHSESRWPSFHRIPKQRSRIRLYQALQKFVAVALGREGNKARKSHRCSSILAPSRAQEERAGGPVIPGRFLPSPWGT